MPIIYRYVLFTLGILILPDRVVQAEYPAYPVIRDQYQLTSTHLGTFAHKSALLEAGDVRLAFTGHWANTNAIRQAYTVDGETVDIRSVLRYGVSPQYELHVEIPFIWQGGGLLDRGIDRWHSLWGMPNGKRDRVPEDSYSVSGQSSGGQHFDWKRPSASIGNSIIGLRRAVRSHTLGDFALEAFLSLPTASGVLGHTGFDVSLGASKDASAGRFQFSYGIYSIILSDTELSNVQYARQRVEGFLATTVPFERFALFATMNASSRVVESLPGHPEFSSYFDFGVHYLPQGQTVYSFAIRENIVSGRGGLDVAFIFGIQLAQFSL